MHGVLTIFVMNAREFLQALYSGGSDAEQGTRIQGGGRFSGEQLYLATRVCRP